jgi:hypothetical protein
MNVTLDSCIRLDKCPTPLMREITRSLEIRNPKFDEAFRCGRWTGKSGAGKSYQMVRAIDSDRGAHTPAFTRETGTGY